jgi:hypothetical protein
MHVTVYSYNTYQKIKNAEINYTDYNYNAAIDSVANIEENIAEVYSWKVLLLFLLDKIKSFRI